MNTEPEVQIKKPILNLLNSAPFNKILKEPGDGTIREYSLSAGKYLFRADFCFNFTNNGILFIEDDDAQRALGNLMKYWMWMEVNGVCSTVYLVHIIGPGNPGQVELCRFVERRIKSEFQKFSYHIIMAEDWNSPEWYEKFRSLMYSLFIPNYRK